MNRASHRPEEALLALGELLAGEDTLLAAEVIKTSEQPVLGCLAAAGPRATAAPAEYALMFELIREGHLLHYAEGRVLRPADPDLALLAGDYLYARGLERLASLGDIDAVRELADLISLGAQLHARETDPETVHALWLASAVAVGCGPSPGHDAAKEALRSERPEAAAGLWEQAGKSAAAADLSSALDRAAEAIGFRQHVA